MIRGYKTELDLNNEQRTACLKHAGCARFAYNWALLRSKAVYQATGKRPSVGALHKELVQLKQTDYPWMYEVSKCCIQEAVRDVEKAYKNFFRRVALKKTGQLKGKAGYPKLKKKSKGIGSFRLYGAIHVFADAVQLPRLGHLRLHEHGYIPTTAKVLSATVSEQAGCWFVSVQVEEEQDKPIPTATTAIGVDLGIKQLATLSDGITFANPRALKHAQKQLRRLERQKSRRKKGSKNRKKTVAKLATVHARIANIRKDATHKLTSYLSKNHALIAIEDLHVAGMLKNHCLAQAVADSNFGEIRRQLEYKATWYGVQLVTVDRFYPSSKTCSRCGWRNEELTLADRTFICRPCGLVLDRDVNAARNIVAVGLIDTQNVPGQQSAGLFIRASETVLEEGETKPASMALPHLITF